MRHTIAISWISYVWFMFSVKLVAKWAKWAGYEALQGGPTRGLPGHDPEECYAYLREIDEDILPIKFREGTWSDDPSKWDFNERLAFENGPKSETRQTALYRLRAKSIRHDTQQYGLIEAHPGMLLTPEEIAAFCRRTGARIVLDTYHIRRQFLWGSNPVPPGFDVESLMKAWADWRRFLPLFLPHVDVVHVQPLRDSDEIWQWLDGRRTELDNILHLTLDFARRRNKVLTFVVELAPPAGLIRKLPWALRIKWIAKAAHDTLQRKLNEYV
jgi:hypothetical protein